MEIVETFSRRQEGRRVKHKFREKKSTSVGKLSNEKRMELKGNRRESFLAKLRTFLPR